MTIFHTAENSNLNVYTSLGWRFETAQLEENTIISSSSFFRLEILFTKCKITMNYSRKNILRGGFIGARRPQQFFLKKLKELTQAGDI